MTENLFASMGLDDVEADPNFIADGKYAAFVFESAIVDIKSGKNTGKKSWVVTYKISGGKFDGKSQQEWFSLDPANEKAKPWLKLRIVSLGVPETKVGSFDPQDVVGTPVFITIKTKDGYQNVRSVEQRNEGDASTEVASTPLAGLL